MPIGNKNLAPYQIKIYSSNTLLRTTAGSLVSVSALTALSDLVSYTANCWEFNYSEVQERDAIEGVGYTLSEDTVSRPQIVPRLSPFLIKSETDDYRAFLKVMRKRHKYYAEIISEYPTRLHSTTDAVHVAIADRTIDNEDGNIKITLTMQYGKALNG